MAVTAPARVVYDETGAATLPLAVSNDTSGDGESWGEPVATGTFAATRDVNWVPFADTTGRSCGSWR